MACSGCKKKSLDGNDMEKTMSIIGKGAIWFVIIWSALAIYGLISLIIDIL